MKKLAMIGAVLSMAAYAMAVPTFTLTPQGAIPDIGGSVDVLVGVSGGDTGLLGVNLYVSVDNMNWEVSNLRISNWILVGGVKTGFPGTVPADFLLAENSNGADIYDATNGTDPQNLIAFCSASSAFAADGKLALVTVKNVGGGTGTMLTTGYGQPSDFSGVEAVQGSLLLPEPVTALLLLGALPFLRRRHA